MALERFGFIVTGKGLSPATNRMVMRSRDFEVTVVGVGSAAEGVEVAVSLVEAGVELLELCGGFGPVHTAKVIEAIGGRVPVGSVGYGPEATAQLAALFA